MKLALAAAAALMTVCASEAAAKPFLDEPPIGSRLGKRLKTEKVDSDKEAALTAHQFATCIVSRQENDVHLFLTAEGQTSAKARKRISGAGDCLSINRPRNDLVEGMRVSFPPDVFRGMLAEQLLKKSMAEAGQLQPLPLQRVYQRAWFASTGRNPVVDEMGACIADVNPAGILTLLRSDPYSEAERTTFATLTPTMAQCLRVGAELQANRQALRAALAEGLYQRIHAPPSLPPASAQTAK